MSGAVPGARLPPAPTPDQGGGRRARSADVARRAAVVYGASRPADAPRAVSRGRALRRAVCRTRQRHAPFLRVAGSAARVFGRARAILMDRAAARRRRPEAGGAASSGLGAGACYRRADPAAVRSGFAVGHRQSWSGHHAGAVVPLVAPLVIGQRSPDTRTG